MNATHGMVGGRPGVITTTTTTKQPSAVSNVSSIASGVPNLTSSTGIASNMNYGVGGASITATEGNTSGGSSTTTTQAGSSTPMTKENEYGLLGLLPLIRSPAKEAVTLGIGVDLTTLVPNISSPDPLHPTFAGPWATAPIKREPEYQIPSCYLVSQPTKIGDKIEMFSDETLFYIFYTMPKDHMQISAARNLQKRDWMYHKDLKVWFRRIPGADPIKTPTSETGSYACMDITRWEEVRKDNITLDYDKLERRY